MRIPRLSLAALALLTSTAPALAGGFQVNLAAQKNIGMGHIGTGLALDQGSIFFNPGALAFVRERGVTIGAAAAIARTAYRDDASGQSFSFKHSTATPAQFYAGFGPQGEGGKPGKWRAGIGIYTPFGATLDYGSGWTGRYSLTKIALLSGFIQPTFSYQITEWLGVGAGFVYGLGYVDLRKDIPLLSQGGGNANIKLETESAATGTGFNLGIYLKPTQMLSVGVSYRSQVDMKVKGGKVTINNIPGAAPVQSAFTAKKFDATLPLPATTSIGIGLTPNEKLTIGADFNFTQWSTYKSLDFDFDGNVGGSPTSTSIRKYKDSFAARLGGQYRVIDALTLRLGGYYDQTPVRNGYITPETPDANRLAGTAGASIHASEHIDIDFAYEFLAFKKRSQTQAELVANGVASDRVAGTYQTYISVVGLGLNYKL